MCDSSNISPNVKEHATLSAGASVDPWVNVETTGEHVNRAADRGCCDSSCSPSLLDAIYRAFDALGAPSDLLGTIGSIGETMKEKECILLIEAWIESKKCNKSSSSESRVDCSPGVDLQTPHQEP
jgi:hypothetical protein